MSEKGDNIIQFPGKEERDARKPMFVKFEKVGNGSPTTEDKKIGDLLRDTFVEMGVTEQVGEGVQDDVEKAEKEIELLHYALVDLQQREKEGKL